MSFVQDFTGGLNNKLNPIRILDNQGQVFENIDIVSNCLTSLKEAKAIDKASDKSPYFFKDNWSFSDRSTSYARLLGLAYRAYNNKLEKTNDGKNWVNMWIEPPEEAPGVTAGELYEYIEGENKDDDDEDKVTPTEGFYGKDIIYMYTYYNSKDGSESFTSPYTSPIEIGKIVGESPNEHQHRGRALVSVVASKDPQIDKIRIYRMGGGILQFVLAKEVDNITEVYIDTTTNDQLGEQCKTLSYTEPPQVNYITAYYALLFGVRTDQTNIIQYSDEAEPLVWNPLNYIVFDELVIGLGASSLGLLVFTEYRVYIIYGTSPAEFQRYLLYDNVGCISHNSIQAYKGSVIWQAQDGIYMFDGSNCTNLTLMTLKSFENIISSCIYDECYYGLFENGNIITIDFKFQQSPIMIILDTFEGIYAAKNRVYGVKNNQLYEIVGSDTYRTLHWRSKAFNENAVTVQKNYKYIQIYVKGDFIFKCYTDGRLAAEVKLKEGYNEVKLQQDLRLGYILELELEGKGQVLELAYSFESRLQSKGV